MAAVAYIVVILLIGNQCHTSKAEEEAATCEALQTAVSTRSESCSANLNTGCDTITCVNRFSATVNTTISYTLDYCNSSNVTLNFLIENGDEVVTNQTITRNESIPTSTNPFHLTLVQEEGGVLFGVRVVDVHFEVTYIPYPSYCFISTTTVSTVTTGPISNPANMSVTTGKGESQKLAGLLLLLPALINTLYL